MDNKPIFDGLFMQDWIRDLHDHLHKKYLGREWFEIEGNGYFKVTING